MNGFSYSVNMKRTEREQLWLVSNTILAFAWRDWGEPQNFPCCHISDESVINYQDG
jgi:hypothetical protein